MNLIPLQTTKSLKTIGSIGYGEFFHCVAATEDPAEEGAVWLDTSNTYLIYIILYEHPYPIR